MSKFIKAVVPPLIPAVVAMLAVEIIVRQGIVKSYLLPTPISVFRASK